MAATRRSLAGAFSAFVVLVGTPVGYIAWLRPKVHAPLPGDGAAWEASKDRIESNLLLFPGPRSVEDGAAMALAEELAVGALIGDGFTVYREEVRHPEGSLHRHAPTHNVLTKAPETGRFWVIAAHLDSATGSPGGDDNMSGVAVALEAAHQLGRGPARDKVVIALFNEEETGLLGSAQFVRETAEKWGNRLAGVVVMDAVGFYVPGPGSQRAPFPLGAFLPDTGDFLSVLTLGESETLAEKFVAARTTAAPDLKLVSFTPPRALAEQLPDLWRSDHAPFWGAQMPALFLTDTADFRNPAYHKPEDTRTTVDSARLAKLAQVLVALVTND